MRLSDEQIDKLADIFADLGVVAVASIVLPALLDRLQFLPAIIGSLCSLVFLIVSLWLLKGKG